MATSSLVKEACGNVSFLTGRIAERSRALHALLLDYRTDCGKFENGNYQVSNAIEANKQALQVLAEELAIALAVMPDIAKLAAGDGRPAAE